MIRTQLATILWARWRMAVHRFHRAGRWASVLGILLAVVLVGIALTSLLLGGGLGYAFQPKMKAEGTGVVWSALTLAFLMFWLLGLLSDLQRDELLSLNKILYLPISPKGLFFLNYLTAYMSLSLVAFLPAMVGLAIALILRQGLLMVWLFPLLASFVAMLTAVTYHLRGWLAQVLVDKRTRRRVTTTLTVLVIAMFQLPQLMQPFIRSETNLVTWTREDQLKWMTILGQGLPPAWLPWGAFQLAQGNWMPAALGTLGGFVISAFSLWRSYRATLAAYLGVSSHRRAQVKSHSTSRQSVPRNWIAFRLPWVAEPVQAIFFTTYRNFSRSPEAKMVLLVTMFAMSPLMGLLVFDKHKEISPSLYPSIHLAAIGFVLYFQAQLCQNQFGWDRQGFRAIVLSPATRREILWGKNLAAIVSMTLSGWIVTLLLMLLLPLSLNDLVTQLIQAITAAILTSSWANIPSILVPMPTSSSVWRKARPSLRTILGQFLCMLLLPLFLAPVMITAGISLLLEEVDMLRPFPVSMFLAFVSLGLVACGYWVLLKAQSQWLHQRELAILTEVTRSAE